MSGKKLTKTLLLVLALGLASCNPETSSSDEISSEGTSDQITSSEVTSKPDSSEVTSKPDSSEDKEPTTSETAVKKELKIDFVNGNNLKDIPTSSEDGTFKIDGYVFNNHGVYLHDDYLFIKNGKSFSNKTSFGKIISISFETTHGMSSSANLQIIGSNSENFASSTTIYDEVPGIEANVTVSFENNNFGFFKLTSTSKNIQLASLSITFESNGDDNTSPETSEPDISIPDSSEDIPSTSETPSDKVPSEDDNRPGIPEGLTSYYGTDGEIQALLNMSGAPLKNRLHEITSSENIVGSYDSLYDSFRTTDIREDGTVWDMYGEYHFSFSNKAGNYKKPGDCYNREHSVPKSWFNESRPMYSDLWHLYPTDGKINGTRGHQQFGDVDDSVSLDTNKVGAPSGNREGNEFGRLDSKWTKYTNAPQDNVFEPREVYKGDFARTYFMMATLYQDKIANGFFNSGNSFSLDSYPSLTDYSINLFMTWAKEDPVSQKEIDRNEAIYKIQKSRNPFIDYPEFADMIWGNLVH